MDEESLPAATVQTSDADQKSDSAVLHFMLQKLKRHIERHLASFLGVQEVLNLIHENCHHAYSEGIEGSIAPTETYSNIAPFTAILRTLASERVPINKLSAIYDCYREQSNKGTSIQSITSQIRQLPKIRSQLWGNDLQHRRFVLSSAVEDDLSRSCKDEEGFYTLTLSRERHEELLHAIMKANQDEIPSSITVRDIRIRPLLRCLIENVCPDIPVLHFDELPPEVQGIPAIQIDRPNQNNHGEALQ